MRETELFRAAPSFLCPSSVRLDDFYASDKLLSWTSICIQMNRIEPFTLAPITMETIMEWQADFGGLTSFPMTKKWNPIYRLWSRLSIFPKANLWQSLQSHIFERPEKLRKKNLKEPNPIQERSTYFILFSICLPKKIIKTFLSS